MNDELEWSRWPWNRCPAQTAQRERCDLRAEHKTPHVAERGLNADVVWSEHYFAVTLERLAEAVGGSDTPADRGVDEILSPLRPAPADQPERICANCGAKHPTDRCEACPTCGAPGDEWCTNPDGSRRGSLHAARPVLADQGEKP